MAVEFKFTGDSDQLASEYDKLGKKVEQLERKNKQLVDQSRRAEDQAKRQAKASKDSFDQSVRSAGSMISSYIGVQAVISQTINLLRMQRAAAEKAGQVGSSAEESLGALAQLAPTDPAKLEMLHQKSRALYGAGGSNDLGEAAQVVFSLESAGMLKDLDVFQQLGSAMVFKEIGGLSTSVKTLVQNIGADETGDTRQLISKGFAASGFSPANVPELLGAAAGAAPSAKALGLTDEELLAFTAMTATGTGSASQGGTQIEAYLAALQKQGGFEGKNLRQGVDEISAMGMSGGELFKYFGSKEGVDAFRAISGDMKGYENILRTVQEAQDADLGGQAAAANLKKPALAAARGKRIANAKKELGEEEIGSISNLADQLQAERATKLRDTQQGDGDGMFYRIMSESSLAMNSMADSTARLIGGDEAFIRDVALDPKDPVQKEIRENLDKIIAGRAAESGEVVAVLKSIDKKLDQRPPATTPNLAKHGRVAANLNTE